MFDDKPDEMVMIFPVVEIEADKSENDSLHTRVPGECRWTFDTTTHWEYSACQAELPFRNGSHIKGTGKCESAPTSDLQTQDPDGQDINADVEIPSGYGIATRPSQNILVPKTDDFDDDGIEDPLTRITGHW